MRSASVLTARGTSLERSEPHVVIIGGGFGGLAAAKVLRHERLRVTLLDRHNHHLFQPLLYQVATATLSPGDIASPIRWIFRHAANVRVLLAEAEAIDVAARQVRLTDGAPVGYDYLIVATGSSHSYFGHDEWARSAPGLKTLEDALEIRRRILLAFERAEREADPARRQELLTFVLVGGGPTGVELAGTLAEIARQTLRDEFRSIDTRQARIVLVEAGATILPTFPPKLRDAARASLQRLGIEVLERTRVTAVDEHGVMLRTTDRLVAGTVLWAAGVAASPLVRRSASRWIAPAGRSSSRICRFQAIPRSSSSATPPPFITRAARRCQAWRRWRCSRRLMPRAPSRPRAWRMASTPFVFTTRAAWRLSGGAQDSPISAGSRFSGTLAWLAWLFLHIFMLIGFRNRLAVLLQWAVAYFTYQRSVRLITYQPPPS